FFCDLFGKRLSSQLLKELSGYADQLVDRLHHMHRDADRPRLVGDGSCDRLADPPGRISTELVSFVIIKLLNRLDKTQVSFLDQVKEEHAPAHVSFGDADYQTEIRLGEFFLRV